MTSFIVFSNLCRCVCNKDSQAKTTNRKIQRRVVYDPLHLANVKGKTINFINILYPKIKFTFISFLQLNVTFEIPLHFSLLDILRSKK